ncbi:MAG: nicotinate-nucleotide adenylyltransferase [Symploca sp. SIO3C6]|uniref:nicotinate-nucleotide adenylyltransferase n=1 Tax=Symploca sp. SIO1C4 TaxID=2607765 RepID=A0A6B3NFU6_9CYAN|nr:nicotinate-nucleotide adenylyltransferase [Symploca sp. SIO3C6]NER28138.1 nicotinate-nucleotide adenylyltransferase [Symploca sp. SIO1C4]NET03426.1 nicotinate-nucleotide adenylyltransferase [Symploca sp. SIO2B6]
MIVNAALFGTSADPPTAAHQVILNWLSHNYDLVIVWASDNPLKSQQTPLKHRSQMLKLLIEEMSAPRQNISLCQNLSSPRTLETVDAVRRQLGLQVDLTLVIGSDLVNQIKCWYQVEKLLRQVKLLVVPRPGYAINQADLEGLRKLGTEAAIAQLQVPSVSSTGYRDWGDTQALTRAVKDYIHQEHLYSCQQAAPNS